MRRYETVVIVDPEISEENRQPVFQRIQDIIDQDNGFLVNLDEWGTKKLAYDIKKKNRGHYVRFDFCGDGALIQEMERVSRIDDRVMKFMTVLLDADADLDAIKADLAEKEAAEEQPAGEAAAPPAEAEAPTETETSTEAEASTEEKKEE
jgi:small subunit ribosomal protein S6